MGMLPAAFVCPTVRFSGGALTFAPWHFIHHRPLQPVVMFIVYQRANQHQG